MRCKYEAYKHSCPIDVSARRKLHVSLLNFFFFQFCPSILHSTRSVVSKTMNISFKDERSVLGIIDFWVDFYKEFHCSTILICMMYTQNFIASHCFSQELKTFISRFQVYVPPFACRFSKGKFIVSSEAFHLSRSLKVLINFYYNCFYLKLA